MGTIALNKVDEEMSNKIADVFIYILTGADVRPFTAKKNSIYKHSVEVVTDVKTAKLNVSVVTSKDINEAYIKLKYKLEEFKEKVLGTRYSSLTDSEQKYLQQRLLIGFSKSKTFSLSYDKDTNKHTITVSYKWSW